MTDDGFVEALLEWGPGGQDPSVNAWLGEHGLAPTPMRGGLLVTGDVRSFRLAFGQDFDPIAGPTPIPIPDAIQDSVSSLSLPRPREIF